MAAGLGFKDFTTGEVLTAADVDGYLMQGIWVFANAAARDAAVTSPQEGNACYLKDTNQVLTYSGSAWVAVGGGSPLTTKGDLYTFSTVDARLAVGANGTTLVADSAEATGLRWASGGGMTLISTTTLSGASVTLSSIPQTYKSLYLVIQGYTGNTANSTLRIKPNDVANLTSAIYIRGYASGNNTFETSADYLYPNYNQSTLRTDANNIITLEINNYTSTTSYKTFSTEAAIIGTDSNLYWVQGAGVFASNTAITSLVMEYAGQTFAGGTVLFYGVN